MRDTSSFIVCNRLNNNKTQPGCDSCVLLCVVVFTEEADSCVSEFVVSVPGQRRSGSLCSHLGPEDQEAPPLPQSKNESAAQRRETHHQILSTNECPSVSQDHKEEVTCVSFNANDSYIASGSTSGDLVLHSLTTNLSSKPFGHGSNQVSCCSGSWNKNNNNKKNK